jgi:hypothetical protein
MVVHTIRCNTCIKANGKRPLQVGIAHPCDRWPRCHPYAAILGCHPYAAILDKD